MKGTKKKTKILCPICQNDTFRRYGLKNDTIIKMYDDGKCIHDDLVDTETHFDDENTPYIYTCCKCNQNITEKEMAHIYYNTNDLISASKTMTDEQVKKIKEERATMKTKKEIEEKINLLKEDDRIKEPDALIQINAPLALIQLSIEAKIAALEWILGERKYLIVG